jgi:hypothetical protein
MIPKSGNRHSEKIMRTQMLLGVAPGPDELQKCVGYARDYPMCRRTATARAPARRRNVLFIRQPSTPILSVPAQAGYGDKWPS